MYMCACVRVYVFDSFFVGAGQFEGRVMDMSLHCYAYVCSYCYIRMCPHTGVCMSSYCYRRWAIRRRGHGYGGSGNRLRDLLALLVQKYALYLLHSYKSTNTDAEGGGRSRLWALSATCSGRSMRLSQVTLDTPFIHPSCRLYRALPAP